ncbi:MAG: polyprenyl diphosphate synthase, partial [Chlamydiales bacterium]
MISDAALMPMQIKADCFHPNQLVRLDRSRIPRHIAIIPDGNRRWAKKRLSSSEMGHREGADTLMDIIRGAREIGIKFLTVYSFSTENWSRPQEEIDALMTLYASYLLENREEMMQNGIKLETIGDLDKLPLFLREIIQEVKMATQQCHHITLILALNYGSRDEMCRVFKAMLEDYERKQLTKDEINEDILASYLDTHEWGDPDLLIRTSGEFRVSNFLLWQVCYAEIFISPVLWPDFTP